MIHVQSLLKRHGPGLLLATAAALLLSAPQPAHAQTETLLYSFCPQPNCADGSSPWAGLLMDRAGNLYGTTVYGGEYDCGTVFKLTPTGTETVVYSFNPNGAPGDGFQPYAGLVMDRKGNLYGTTLYGGADNYGTVFKVTPTGAETVLYSFNPDGVPGDGFHPYAGLILDSADNLYGTTEYGGANGDGTVFKVTPRGTETVLYSFGSQSGDGINPYAGLLMDKQGNLYGTTLYGGANNLGTVFKLTSSGTETVLYSFSPYGDDGHHPYAGVIMDKLGNLYGTTELGGRGEVVGTVFELTPAGVETVLYSFTGGYTDGEQPYSGLVMGKKGKLYGASSHGQSPNYGALFELSPPSRKKGPWTFTSLHAFNSGNGDGIEPYGTPILDIEGNLYGTTYVGGAYNQGTVWRVTP